MDACRHAPFAFGAVGAVRGYARQPNGILLDLGGPSLNVQVCSEAIVHVVYSSSGKASDRPDYLVVRPCPVQSTFEVADENDALVVSTAALKARVVGNRRQLWRLSPNCP